MIKIGDKVEGLTHPKHGNKPFKGVGTITMICEVPDNYCWVEWYDQGRCTGLIQSNELVKISEGKKV